MRTFVDFGSGTHWKVGRAQGFDLWQLTPELRHSVRVDAAHVRFPGLVAATAGRVLDAGGAAMASLYA